MTNDAVSKVGASPSNPTLSLPSSSTFSSLSNQSDIYRIEEESEIYDNSKGDNSEWYNNRTWKWGNICLQRI